MIKSYYTKNSSDYMAVSTSHSFVRSFVRFVPSFLRPSDRPSVRPSVRSFFRSLVCSAFIRSFARSIFIYTQLKIHQVDRIQNYKINYQYQNVQNM